mmetsp:Transcript_4376/g.12808  ORF Transcript_4376/g.12808 Transcript_4376/m.12808 type:complete len:411 (-) Transcript_4376:985-2217(-)
MGARWGEKVDAKERRQLRVHVPDHWCGRVGRDSELHARGEGHDNLAHAAHKECGDGAINEPSGIASDKLRSFSQSWGRVVARTGAAAAKTPAPQLPLDVLGRPVVHARRCVHEHVEPGGRCPARLCDGARSVRGRVSESALCVELRLHQGIEVSPVRRLHGEQHAQGHGYPRHCAGEGEGVGGGGHLHDARAPVCRELRSRQGGPAPDRAVLHIASKEDRHVVLRRGPIRGGRRRGKNGALCHREPRVGGGEVERRPLGGVGGPAWPGPSIRVRALEARQVVRGSYERANEDEEGSPRAGQVRAPALDLRVARGEVGLLRLVPSHGLVEGAQASFLKENFGHSTNPDLLQRATVLGTRACRAIQGGLELKFRGAPQVLARGRDDGTPVAVLDVRGIHRFRRHKSAHQLRI